MKKRFLIVLFVVFLGGALALLFTTIPARAQGSCTLLGDIDIVEQNVLRMDER